MKNSKFYFIFTLFIVPLVYYNAQGQTKKTDLTSQDILEKTIKYHDPNGLWDNYKGKLYEVTVIYPWNYVVRETIEIDNKNDFYLSTCFQDFGTLKRGIDKGKNIFSLDDKPEIPDEIKANWGISDEGIKNFSAEHHGHFGLPMVLKNSGMELQNDAKIVDFDGRKCYAITFVGKPNSIYNGERILYIDLNNYSMRGLSYIDGNNSGYIVFSGEIDINGLKVVHAKIGYYKDQVHTYSSTNYLVQN